MKQGLQGKYKKQIEVWFVYLDQVKFGEELEKQLLKEVDRFMANKKTIDEIMAELFKEPDWMKKIEEALIEKHPDLKVSRNIILGYA